MLASSANPAIKAGITGFRIARLMPHMWTPKPGMRRPWLKTGRGGRAGCPGSTSNRLAALCRPRSAPLVKDTARLRMHPAGMFLSGERSSSPKVETMITKGPPSSSSPSDYCDLSGEVQWVRRMLDRYGEIAKAVGARIVHCCGFESRTALPASCSQGLWKTSRPGNLENVSLGLIAENMRSAVKF